VLVPANLQGHCHRFTKPVQRKHFTSKKDHCQPLPTTESYGCHVSLSSRLYQCRECLPTSTKDSKELADPLDVMQSQKSPNTYYLVMLQLLVKHMIMLSRETLQPAVILPVVWNSITPEVHPCHCTSHATISCDGLFLGLLPPFSF
jgi:hypothetical protein